MDTKTRVLIVDDDPDFTDVLHYEMSQFEDRYRIDSVNNFDAGLLEIRRGHYDVYLVDYQLDCGHTGDRLVEEAASLARPILMLTGVDDDALEDRVIGVGASDFLLKANVNGKLVDRAIRNALSR